MNEVRRLRLAAITFAVLLLIASSCLFLLYPSHQHLIDRSVQTLAAESRMTPVEVRRITYPVVMRLIDRTCVQLLSTLRDGGEFYLACYDDRTGKVQEERMAMSGGPMWRRNGARPSLAGQNPPADLRLGLPHIARAASQPRSVSRWPTFEIAGRWLRPLSA